MGDPNNLSCSRNSYRHAKGFLRSLLTIWARALNTFASTGIVLLSTSVSKVDVILKFQTNKQTNTHPSPLLLTQPVRSPAPLTALPAKIRALQYNSCINIISYFTVNTARTHYKDPLRGTTAAIK